VLGEVGLQNTLIRLFAIDMQTEKFGVFLVLRSITSIVISTYIVEVEGEGEAP